MAGRPPPRATPAASPELEDLLARIAANARHLRTERGWTQEEAAQRCDGLSPYVYRQVEGALTNLTAATVARLVRGFAVDVAALFAPAPPPVRRPGRPPKAIPAPPPEPPRAPPLRTNPTPDSGDRPGGDDDLRAQLRARRADLATELARLDLTLGTLGDVTAESSARLRPTTIVVPALPARRPDLRTFLLALIDANPQGLTTSEMLAVVREHLRPRVKPNEVHYLVHNLFARDHLVREGSRGAFVYRRRATTSSTS